MILAMAQWQMQQVDAARKSLAEGLRLAVKRLPAASSGDVGDGWIDWIFAHALMREAGALIQPQNTLQAE
jgi:hypothetical protein